MSTIYDVANVKGFIRMCNDGWLQGWHERNGGNLTYRMTEEDVAACRPFFDETPREWVNMGVQADNLAGEYFITTGSGKFFRNVEPDPIHSIGIVEINDKGDSWRIVWGLADGAKPTSEFPSHFMNHSVRKAATNGANRVIYHCHATNVIALTYILPLTDRDFTRALWQSATECPARQKRQTPAKAAQALHRVPCWLIHRYKAAKGHREPPRSGYIPAQYWPKRQGHV